MEEKKLGDGREHQGYPSFRKFTRSHKGEVHAYPNDKKTCSTIKSGTHIFKTSWVLGEIFLQVKPNSIKQARKYAELYLERIVMV